MTVRLAIAGAGGRMGRMLIEAASKDAMVSVTAALEHGASPLVGATVDGIRVTADIEAALSNADVLIDFTRPEGTLVHLAHCAQLGVRAVVGTTGFDAAGTEVIARMAKQTGVVHAPNMSMGVNVTARLVRDAARALGMDADIEVFEAHHRHKVDAPSGTALMLGRVAAEARGQKLDEVAVYDRHGVTGERVAGTIGFTTMRAGDIIGDHTVFLVLNGERIEITHRSNSRATYAEGAIRAAKWLVGEKKANGLYDMNDVLGLS